MKNISMRLYMSFITLFCTPAMRANQWPQFRGPHGNQLSQDTQWPQVWSNDTNILWQVKIPGRASTPYCGKPVLPMLHR